MAKMLNSPIQHSIGPVSATMPCVTVKEERDDMEPYQSTHYISRQDFKVENPYDGMYDDCNGTNHLTSHTDDNQQHSSDDDSSRDSSDDGAGEFNPEEIGGLISHDTDSDSSSESSSSGSSSSSSSTETMDDTGDDVPAVTQLMCENCGKGPFKNLKVHLHHCSDMASPFQCSVCKKSFRNEKAQLKHRARYHVCFLCSEVFVHWSLYSTKVTSKVCIITNPALMTPISTASAAGGSGLVLSSSGVAPSQDIRGIPPTMNGHCFKTEEGLLNGHVANFVTDAQTPPHKSKTKPQAPVQSAFQHRVNTRSRAASIAANAGATSALTRQAKPSWTAATVVCKAKPTAEHPPIVMRISKTKSQEPKKSLRTSWRSKGSYPCRQCGAVSQQPSLAVSHRYRHRGRRLHRCLCGRSFLQRLHLLRHCVQHAEASSYICAKCGETFRGAKLLVEHLTGQSRKPAGVSWTQKSRKSCIKKVPFCCECGLCFDRPSAYIWHQLQNMQKPKVHRKRLK
ncbi:unnamed protein product [Boreogadus saida]